MYPYLYLLMTVLTLSGFTAGAQDYRFTMALHLNQSQGKSQYSRTIGVWDTDNRSLNIGADLAWKLYPWLDTRPFIYAGARLSYQRSTSRIVPDPEFIVPGMGDNDWGFAWATTALVLRYGRTVDWSPYLATAFTGGVSLGVQHGHRYESGWERVLITPDGQYQSPGGQGSYSRRFLQSGKLMPALELGLELFPLGSNRRWSVSCTYVQHLVASTPAQASTVYERTDMGMRQEYGLSHRIRYANVVCGLHYAFGKLKGVRVNRSNRDLCKSI